jgi:hypothetical protein
MRLMQGWLMAGCLVLAAFQAESQCSYPIDSVDEFDHTRLVAFAPINIGYLIASEVETETGLLPIEEGKVMFTFSQNDTLNSFFLTLAIPERNYMAIEPGFNVLLKLNNNQIVRLYNFPDKGTFDPKTNMRIYQHTGVVPLDLFYNLTHHTITRIRIRYKGYKKTISVTPEQQEAIREAIRCIGEAVELFPIKP